MEPESNQPSEIARRLQFLQTDTEARLERVENSVFFRGLRWLGEKTGYAQRLRDRVAADTTRDYSNWTERCAWMEPSGDECARQIETWHRTPDISYFAGSTDAAGSVSKQHVPPSQTLAFTDAATWRQAVCAAQGDYSVILPADARVSALASYRWSELLENDGIDAAYSDWDHVSADRQRHTPRFTPEFSPALLRGTPYWGGCFLVRTSLLKELGSDLDPSAAAWTHSLAQRLAEEKKAITRVPRILWHSTNTPSTRQGTDTSVQPGVPSNASIVICSRTPRLLEQCLRALRRSDTALAEIVVVAHAGGPLAKLQRIAATHGAAAVPYSGQFHFGLMNAAGAQHSTRPSVVFLNDDVEPIAAGWLSALLGALNTPGTGIAGGLLLYPNDTVQHAGIALGGWPAHIGRGQASTPLWPWLRLSREVTAVTGACLAIRRTLWDELGGFDRRFPVNYNDVDLCLRARRAGYSVVLESGALLYHHEAQTRSTMVTAAERALFSSLWTLPLTTADPFFSPNLSLRDEQITLAEPNLVG